MAVSKKDKAARRYYRAVTRTQRIAKPLTALQFVRLLRRFYEYARDKGFYETPREAIESKGFYIYRWQKEIAEAILKSVFMQIDMDILVSVFRQVGKTEFVSLTTAFCFDKFFNLYKRPINIAIIAPEKDLAGVVFRRITKYIDTKCLVDGGDTKKYKESKRGDSIQLFGIYDEYKGATIEGRDFDMIIRDEAHLGNDSKFIDEVEPTMWSKRGPLILIGNGGKKRCLFSEAIKSGSQIEYESDGTTIAHETVLIRYTYKEGKQYLQNLADQGIESSKTRINSIERYIKKHGGHENIDVLKNVYCKWIFEHGNPMSEANLLRCHNRFIKWELSSPRPLYLGLDFATLHDRTVATIMDGNRSIIDWIILKDANEIKKVREQCSMLRDICDDRGYTKHLLAIGFDATGVGSGGVVEFLEEEFICDLIPYVFSDKNKHDWYAAAIEAITTVYDEDRLNYNPEHPHTLLFEKECLALERRPLSVKKFTAYSAPRRAGYYDDFFASLAIVMNLINKDLSQYTNLKSYNERFPDNTKKWVLGDPLDEKPMPERFAFYSRYTDKIKK